MAYTNLKVHRKRLLKLPLEGLREFLPDSLAQPWALEDKAVLRHLRASMTQLRRMRCDLPPTQRDLRSSPRGPWAWSECPRRPGLSSLLRPLSHRPGWRSRPPWAQPPSLSCPDPLPARPSSNFPPAMELPPHPPSATDGAGRWPPDMVGLKTKNGVPFPSAPAWATREAPRWTRPWSTPGTPMTGSPQPPRDDAVGPRTPFLPRSHCSSCSSLGSDRHSQGRARVALSPLPRGPAQARDPLPSASTMQLDARGPLGQSVAGRPDARVRTPQTLLRLSLCPRPGRAWDRVTAGEPQVTRVCAKRPERSVLPLSRGPGLPGLWGPSSPPRPRPVHLGHRGPAGRSAWPQRGRQDSRPLQLTHLGHPHQAGSACTPGAAGSLAPECGGHPACPRG
ncbi:uncharacterized protein LOC144283545 isoform X1 [Canis aureus]